MDGRSMLGDGGAVVGCGIALVLSPAILGKLMIELAHELITVCLGQNRGRRYAEHLAVALDNGGERDILIRGEAVAVNGKKMNGVQLIEEVNKIAARNGVGRIDHVEDRLVGIKSRETYECPAAMVLTQAHRSLEFLTLQKDVLEFKKIVEQRYSQLVYNGLWFGTLRESLASFIDTTQEFVTGTIRVKLFKGTVTVVGRKSPYSLYDEGLATYAKGDEFDHKSAVGFIYCWGLPNKTTAKAHKK